MAGHRIWRQHSLACSCGQGAVFVLAALATGCKSGSWGAKPSWWGFGGTTPSSSLAAAPEFDKDVTKPSEAAKPYPTTTTPEAYSLAGGEQPTATPGGRPTLEPTSITYGATPPAAAQPQAVAQAPAQPGGPAGAQAGVGPQVGPYASLQPAPSSPPPVDPAAAATAGLAAAPAFGEATPPAAAPRVADARGSDAWAAAPPAAGGDPRYGTTTGSRFSGGFQPAAIEPPPLTAPAAPPATPAPPAFSSPATPAALPAASLDPAPGGVAPPAAAGDALPGSLAPPRRRPDPGYRPGGTSSYRPSRSILAEDEAAPGGVLPASFEAAQAPGR